MSLHKELYVPLHWEQKLLPDRGCPLRLMAAVLQRGPARHEDGTSIRSHGQPGAFTSLCPSSNALLHVCISRNFHVPEDMREKQNFLSHFFFSLCFLGLWLSSGSLAKGWAWTTYKGWMTQNCLRNLAITPVPPLISKHHIPCCNTSVDLHICSPVKSNLSHI